jgi:hypothetical protein
MMHKMHSADVALTYAREYAAPTCGCLTPPTFPVEMKDVQVQHESGSRGREMWDVTFLSTGYVRVEKLVLNSVGQLEEPSEETMSVERFFRAKPTWPPHIRAFKFQNEALPQLLSRGIDRIF